MLCLCSPVKPTTLLCLQKDKVPPVTPAECQGYPERGKGIVITRPRIICHSGIPAAELSRTQLLLMTIQRRLGTPVAVARVQHCVHPGSTQAMQCPTESVIQTEYMQKLRPAPILHDTVKSMVAPSTDLHLVAGLRWPLHRVGEWEVDLLLRLQRATENNVVGDLVLHHTATRQLPLPRGAVAQL